MCFVGGGNQSLGHTPQLWGCGDGAVLKAPCPARFIDRVASDWDEFASRVMQVMLSRKKNGVFGVTSISYKREFVTRPPVIAGPRGPAIQ